MERNPEKLIIRKMSKIIVLLTIALVLTSCTKEDAPITMEISITASFHIGDPEYWPGDEKVVFGIFNSGAYSAIKEIEVVKPAEDVLDVVLEDIAPGEYVCKLFISENNQNLAVLVDYGLQMFKNTTVLSTRNFSFITLNRVQQQVFTKCYTCHGSSNGQPAAGLILLEGQSYTNLVNVAAENSDMLRVKPFASDESFLINVIDRNNISFDHSASSGLSKSDKDLVIHWIDEGALDD